ncbi:helix-turn-helix domain-containing protein [Streptomyces sp. SAS_270]|uniref:helix-turn-helix domain-containing protein n=1 Tax=Streptomyces sp. SAS_270 TaxID=3412748 RepID=UPI00403C1E56
MLSTLGLDAASVRVYRTMLAHPQTDFDALQDHLGICEAELRSALDNLSSLALVRRHPDGMERFRTVDPRVAVQTLLARQQARLAAEQERSERTKLAAGELIAELGAADGRRPVELVERLDDAQEIRDRAGALLHGAREEVLTLSPGAFGEDWQRAARLLERELLERGVRLRTLCLDSVHNSGPDLECARGLAECGGQVRTAPALPVRFVVVDRRTALVPVDGESSTSGALILTGGGTVTALCALFECVWRGAVPLGGGARERDEHGLTAQAAEALRLLGQGLTDEAIAKRLGVSPRTARRISAELLEALGARSRFQAGCRAVARGWLPAEE